MKETRADSEPGRGEGAWPSLRSGARATGGLAVGGLVFGMLFGIVAISRGLSEWQALLMSATVFAGAAQVAVMEIWSDPLPYLPIAVTAALVCSRHVLMGITLYETLSHNRKRPPFATLFLLTDANWVLTVRDTRVTHRIAFFTGSGLTMYAGWMIGSAVGVIVPGVLDDATISGLRLGGALFMAILLCIYFQGSRWPRLVAPAISAAVAVAASRFLDSAASLMVGVAAAALATLVREQLRRG
jgi:predicted branched-subunit amino acid permease